MNASPAYGYTWAFVALEYYALMLNRIYLVLVGDRTVSGAYMGGPVAARPFPEAAWQPGYWLTGSYLDKYAGLNVAGPEFTSVSWHNFQYSRSDIVDVAYDASPKWGMSSVPYSGRIHITWRTGRPRELILLGRQDGVGIRDRLAPLGGRYAAAPGDAVPVPVFDPLNWRPDTAG